MSEGTALLAPPVSARRDHVRGAEGAPITLVEYGDYACAFCTRTYPVIETLREELEGRLRLAYRHFAVTSPSRSLPAAEAAEAAGAQGAFWPMHDALSKERGARLDGERLHELAKEVGLDMDRFADDFEERSGARRIRADYESAKASGVEGTPAFFVGRRRYDAEAKPHDLLGGLQMEARRRAVAQGDVERLTRILAEARLA